MIRLYGSSPPTETILDVIREDGLDLKVMLGVWIAPEEAWDEAGNLTGRFPERAEANRNEVESGIRLAAAYPGIVTSLCVGNETQVFWSPHRSKLETVVQYIRRVRAGTELPVTTADDFNYWNKPESRALAQEVDFINCYAHPLWNGIQLEDALQWTEKTYAGIRAAHPDREVVLGETGWATAKHDEGEQARLIQGRTGEEEQKAFYEEVAAWSRREKIPVFFFEVFDENWKGGDHPDEVEKHWGLLRADRTPKKAVADES
jgi:exo-beta-1,3-glucanase (GH17 family)